MTFVTLVRLTTEGAKTIGEGRKRYEAYEKLVNDAGGRVVAAYGLLGEYDIVTVTEYQMRKPPPGLRWRPVRAEQSVRKPLRRSRSKSSTTWPKKPWGLLKPRGRHAPSGGRPAPTGTSDSIFARSKAIEGGAGAGTFLIFAHVGPWL